MIENELEKYVDEWRPASKLPQADFAARYDFKPGMLLKLESGEVFLVGHLNPEGGTCDCLPDVDRYVENSNIIEWGWLSHLKENED